MQDLEKFKNEMNLSGKNVYVGHRYVPKIISEWDNTQLYEPLSIVTYQGASYTSRQYVPVGVDIKNEEFWAVTGNYNAQVEAYRKDVRDVQNEIKAVDEKLTNKLEKNAVHLDDYIIDGVLNHTTFIELLSKATLFILNSDVTIKPEITHELTNDISIISHNHSRLYVDGTNVLPLIQTKGSFNLENIHLAGHGLVVYGNLNDSDIIERISFKNNTIGGNLNDSLTPLKLVTQRQYNPLNGFFGVKTVEIVDNKFIDLYSDTGRPFELRDVCWDNLLFNHNNVQNFFPRIIDASTNNNHTYSSEMTKAHKNFEAIQNTIQNDDSFKPYDLYPTNNATYYSPVIVESVKSVFEKNIINGMHYIQRDGETAPNVYAAYLSSVDVIWRDNQFNNIVLFSDSKFYGDLFKSKYGEGIRIYEDNVVTIDESYYDRLNVSSYGVTKQSMWSSIFGFQGNMGDVHFNRNVIKVPSLKIARNYIEYIQNLYFNDNVFEINSSADTLFFAAISDRTKSIQLRNNKVKSTDIANTSMGLLAVNTTVNNERLIQIQNNTFENINTPRLIWKYSESANLDKTNVQIVDNDLFGVNNNLYGLLENIHFNTVLLENNQFNGEVINESLSTELVISNTVLGSLPNDLYIKKQLYKKWVNKKWFDIRIPRENLLPSGTEMLGTIEIESSKQHGTYRLEFEGIIQDGIFELIGDIGSAPDGVPNESTVYNKTTIPLDGSTANFTNRTLENKGRSMSIISNQILNGASRRGIGLRFETTEPVRDVVLSITIVKK